MLGRHRLHVAGGELNASKQITIQLKWRKEDRLIRRLAVLVTELDLDRRDFVIFGSGPLLAHGLRDGIRDLDIVARGAAWRRVRAYGCPGTGSSNGAPMALFWDGLIQFSRGLDISRLGSR